MNHRDRTSLRPDPPPDVPRRRRLGFTGLALGSMLHRDGIVRAEPATAPPWSPPDGKAAFRPEGEERHLDLPLRRRQPPGDLGPQARPQQVRRQDLRRDALSQPAQVAAVPRAVARRRRRRPAPLADLPAAGRVQEARPGGRRDQRLVAAPGDVRRRHRLRPLDVHDRQRPRGRVPDAPRPAQARREAAGASARGSTTAWAP